MRIEELVLEGFKSYPVRTQITGWDSSFNAITGLNGSGKSNILDAICFVLGITDMKQMRAANQQDLIYKRGQAGITKASVTVVFNNSDRATSPVGFENLPQITVTRQIALPNISKYLLNGHKSTQQAILTLFQSVQLNINNPNFVIMQGRITKVLNMRPQEILGMVEEAAGTRMFEDRKEKAKRTMGKKEKRVEEITSLLNEEITPKLDTLRAEKRSYLAYQKTASELERLSRVLRAYEWTEAVWRSKQKESAVDEKRDEVDALKGERAAREKEGAEAEKEREKLERRRDKEIQKGGKLKGLEEEVGKGQRELARLSTQLEIKVGTIADEDSKVHKVQKAVEDLQASLAAKIEQVKELAASYGTLKESHTATQTKIATSEELLQTLVTGLSSSDSGNTGGYLGQLAEAKNRLAAATTAEEQGRMKLGMAEKELKEKSAKWKEVEREAGEGTKAIEKGRKEVEALRKKVQDSGWSVEREAHVDVELKKAKENVRMLTEERDSIKTRLSALDFSYSDPAPNFDRSKVKGLVATLINLPDTSHQYSTALEIAAGGKLYNVVVEDEKVGSQLLQNGKLKKRVTIIPLNKINAFKLSAEKLNAAKKIAPNKAHLALTLVGFPDEVSSAMAYVFGDTIICADSESAKAVTFNKAVGVKSVTLDGDVYDPSGMLSGGSAPSGNGMLIKVQELNRKEAELNEAKDLLRQLDSKEAKERAGRDGWKKMGRELEIKEHELGLLEEQIGGSNAARIGTDIENLKKSIESLKASVEEAKEKQSEAKAECKKFEKDMDDFKNNKDSKLKELKGEIAKQKGEISKQALVLKAKHKELQTAELERDQIEKDIKSSEAEVKEAQAGAQKSKDELVVLQKQHDTFQKSHEKVELQLKKERADLDRYDLELRDLEKVIKEKKQAISDADLGIKDAEHQIQTLLKDKQTADNAVANLQKAYPWILEDRRQFGKADGAYDFEKINMAQAREKARELEDQQKGMKKKINPKVMNMIDSVEKKEVALKKMLSQVLKDKSKIEETIAELELHKRSALQKTWEKVNGDFGGIFAELLPGNFAKLEPVGDVTEGLEVKVRLGNVWKQSLTELSGGQRSLIALSLIMSLLQFKPAPMYILDEIDAALDLSHTQHIGQLFKNRFKGSQFIVVSLKEGLFTNANVLFRARFRDGTSVVERTAQRSASVMYAEGEDKENDGGDLAGGRARKGRK